MGLKAVHMKQGVFHMVGQAFLNVFLERKVVEALKLVDLAELHIGGSREDGTNFLGILHDARSRGVNVSGFGLPCIRIDLDDGRRGVLGRRDCVSWKIDDFPRPSSASGVR